MTGTPTRDASTRDRVAERRRPLRTTAVVVGVAVAVALLGQALLSSLDSLRFSPGSTPIVIPRTATVEPPPRFEGEPSDQDRVAYYLLELRERDRDSAAWATTQLRRGGAALREPLLGVLRRSLESNSALVQHVLDVLVTEPHEDMLPLAGELLVRRGGQADPGVLSRACELIAAIGGAGADALAPRLADAALEAPAPVPRHAIDALARIGGPLSRVEVRRAVRGVDSGYKGEAYMSLLRLPGDDITAFLAEEYDAEEDPWRKLVAAEALVRRGSTHATEWLREQARESPTGTAFREAAASALAYSGDTVALDVLTDWVRDRLDVLRQERAIKALAPFELAQKETILREAAALDQPREVRLAAWEQLLRQGGAAARSEILSMLLAAGPENLELRRTAVLAIGHSPWRGAAPTLRSAFLGAGATDSEMRIFLLRAMVKCEDPDTAALVVRQIAEDPSPYGVVSLAAQVQAVLHHASEEYRRAAGTHVRAALANGGAGARRGAGLHAMLVLSMRCCGEEVAPEVEPFLEDPDQPLRETAADVLAYIGRRQSMRALRAAWAHQDEYTRMVLASTMARLHYRWPDPPR